MTREELNEIVSKDLKRFDTAPSLKDKIANNESWYIFRLIKHIRLEEFHMNKGGWHKLARLWHKLMYKRLSFKLNITIYPGTVGAGLRIYHAGGFTHIGKHCRIGKNCTIVSGVVFGNKYEEETDEITIVGDNCYFGIGARILGAVKIGNNVTVGANSVVTKDIPDNAIVGGVPAKIIRIKN